VTRDQQADTETIAKWLDEMEAELQRTEWLWFLKEHYPDYDSDLAVISDYYSMTTSEEDYYRPTYTIDQIMECNGLTSSSQVYRVLRAWRCPTDRSNTGSAGLDDLPNPWGSGTVESIALAGYVKRLWETEPELPFREVWDRCKEFYPEVSQYRLRKMRTRLGVGKQPHGNTPTFTPAQTAEVLRLRRLGNSYVKIGQRTGISREQVRRMCIEGRVDEGWQ